MDSFSDFLFSLGSWVDLYSSKPKRWKYNKDPHWIPCIGPQKTEVFGAEGFQSALLFGLLLLFLGCLLGFPMSFLLSYREFVSSWIIKISRLCSGFSLLPLASHFSSLFSAPSIILPFSALPLFCSFHYSLPGLLYFDILRGWFLWPLEVLVSWECTIVWGKNGCLVSSVTFKVWIFPECSLPEAFGDVFRFADVVENGGYQMSE